jgi:hypothetical protein
VSKKNAILQNSRTRKVGKILNVKDGGSESVGNIKYLWAVISNTDGETEKVNVSIPAGNKAYYFLHSTF